jgi:hypothetical protein
MALHRRMRPSTAAARLLAGLATNGSYAVADPTASGSVILRSARAGVSLGGGRFKDSAAEALVSRDLARWTTAEGRRRLEITDAGRAYLRRGVAGTAQEGFLAQHRTLSRSVVEGSAGPVSVTLDAEESPLAWLSRRKDADGRPFLDAAAVAAGERLRLDLTVGGMLPSVTARWEIGVDGGGGLAGTGPAAATDAMVAARQRVTRALKDVGEDFADLLIDVCGFLKALEAVERERRWPARSGKVVVRLALWRLAEHYGIEREARGPDRSRGIRNWRDASAAA